MTTSQPSGKQGIARKATGRSAAAGKVPASEPRPVDEIDERIVTLLTGDARLSARAIAREVGMSPGAISERIDRLEADGIITGYHAVVDIAALGFPLRAIVSVRVDRGEDALSGVIDKLMTIRNVQTVKLVTGEWDLLVEIVVRDGPQLREILVSKVAQFPGVTATATAMNLETRRRQGAWSPL